MTKLISITNKILIITFLLSLIFVVFLQVFARVLLPHTPSWTEEVARFALVYLVASASGLTFKKNLFVNVDLIFHIKIHEKIIYWIRIAIQGIVFFSSLIMAMYSFPIIKIGLSQTSPALLLPMYIIFMTMFIIPASIIMAQAYNIYAYFFITGRNKC